jgi:hypothetical protein
VEKTEHEITRVRLESGDWVDLTELPCDNCGQEGCTHLAVWGDGANAFCSWEHLQASMRINDEPLTTASMVAAGLHIIGPRPQA